MALRSRIVLLAFVLWTGFVWVNRIANTLRSETESAGAKTFSSVLSVVLLAFAVAVIVVLVAAWSSPLSAGGAKVLMTAAALTVVVWLVRVPQILIADHTAAFKVVHVALGVISVVLAALVWQIGAVVVRGGRDRGTMKSSRV